MPLAQSSAGVTTYLHTDELGLGTPHSVFGQVGQTYGGENGGLTGEGVKLAATVVALATGNPQARAANFGLAVAQFAVSVACGSE
jgi:hypothetical protein